MADQWGDDPIPFFSLTTLKDFTDSVLGRRVR